MYGFLREYGLEAGGALGAGVELSINQGVTFGWRIAENQTQSVAVAGIIVLQR
jgi:hypothetical protein